MSETWLCLTHAYAIYNRVLQQCVTTGDDEDSCPEGYELWDGTCATFVAVAGSQIQLLVQIAGGLLTCTDIDGLSEDESKCQWKAMRAYGRWGAARGDCFRKCRLDERGNTTDGSCDPRAATDSETLECLAEAEQKLVTKLASVCADEPECVDVGYLRDAELRPIVDMVATSVSDTYVAPATCGDSVVEVPLEECDPPGPTNCEGSVCSALCTCGATQGRVFATSTLTSGDMGNLSGADSICQARADAAALGGTFKAWLSSASTTAASRLTHNPVGYKLVDGTVIADSWTDLTDGALDAPIDKDEFGNAVSGDAWTDTTTAGNIGPAECAQWTSVLVGHKGSTGSTTSATSTWTSNVVYEDCAQLRRLYCFEQ